MDAREFLGLQPTHNPHRWVLPVTTGIATSGKFLFGGCGLGAAIVALEETLDRPVVWATAQYLSYAMVDEVVDIDVTVASSGHYTSQARVVAHVGDREVLTVNAALGERSEELSAQWGSPPDVAGPAESVQRELRTDGDSLMNRLDTRIAAGVQWDELGEGRKMADGTSALWVRMPGLEMSAAGLAVLGDYVPYGISQALGQWMRSNSLDNTLRIHRVPPTEWVLLDIAVHGVDRGVGHGRVHLWNEAGVLLATASQSAIVRGPHIE